MGVCIDLCVHHYFFHHINWKWNWGQLHSSFSAIKSHASQAGLKSTVNPRMILNIRPPASTSYILGSQVFHTMPGLFSVEDEAQCKQSTNWASSWPQPCLFLVWHWEFQSLGGLMTWNKQFSWSKARRTQIEEKSERVLLPGVCSKCNIFNY